MDAAAALIREQHKKTQALQNTLVEPSNAADQTTDQKIKSGLGELAESLGALRALGADAVERGAAAVAAESQRVAPAPEPAFSRAPTPTPPETESSHAPRSAADAALIANLESRLAAAEAKSKAEVAARIEADKRRDAAEERARSEAARAETLQAAL